MRSFSRFISSYFENSAVRFNVGILFGFLLNAAYIVFSLVLGIMHGNVWYISVSAYYTLVVALRYLLIGASEEEGGTISASTVSTLILILFLPMSGIIFYSVITGAAYLSGRAPIVVFGLYAVIGILRAIYGLLISKSRKSSVYRIAQLIRLSLALISLFNFQTSLFSMLDFGAHLALFLNFLMGGAVSFSMLVLAKESRKGDLS